MGFQHIQLTKKKTVLRSSHSLKLLFLSHLNPQHRCLIAKTSVIGVPFQTHIIFLTYLYGSHTSNTPSKPSKSKESFDLFIHPSCYFFVKTHHRGTLQLKLGNLTGLRNLYLSKTSSLLNFHQNNHLRSEHCSNRNPAIGINLDSLRWKIGALLIRYKYDKPSKPLLKEIKFAFRTL